MFVRAQIRRPARLGNTATDLLLPRWAGGQPIEDIVQNALPDWAGGMQITPAQAAKIAAQTPGGMTADEILAYNQKHPATLPGDENSIWAKLTSNAGGTGHPNWGLIGFGTIAVWGVVGLATLYIGGKVLSAGLK